MPSLGISKVVDCPDPGNPELMNIADCSGCNHCQEIDEFKETLECSFEESDSDMFCPICRRTMDIFDQSEETGIRYVCNDCEHIVSITPMEN